MFIQRGFTLIELIVVMAIMAIVGVIVTPSFSDMIAQQKLSRAASEIASSLTQARAQAAVRRAATVVCLNNKNNGTETTLSACAISNIPNYASLDAAQQTAAQQTRTFLVEVPKGVTVVGATTFVIFQQNGTPTAARTLSLCKATVQHNVSVSLTGNVRNVKGAC